MHEVKNVKSEMNDKQEIAERRVSEQSNRNYPKQITEIKKL